MGIMQNNPNPSPSSGPVEQAPPTGSSPTGTAIGPGQPPEQQFQELSDQAVMMVYNDRFPQLIKMFETNGAERFGRSMAVAVNTVLTELEKQSPMDPEMAANVGMDIYMKLLEDIITGGIVPDVTLEQVQSALPQALEMYQQSHPGITPEDVQTVMQSAQQAAGGM